MSKLLEPLLPSSPASRILEVTRLKEFDDYLKENPRSFSWKTVAEVLYRCGHETLLNELFTYMKSPEGMQEFCLGMHESGTLMISFCCVHTQDLNFLRTIIIIGFIHRYLTFPFQIENGDDIRN